MTAAGVNAREQYLRRLREHEANAAAAMTAGQAQWTITAAVILARAIRDEAICEAWDRVPREPREDA